MLRHAESSPAEEVGETLKVKIRPFLPALTLLACLKKRWLLDSERSGGYWQLSPMKKTLLLALATLALTSSLVISAETKKKQCIHCKGSGTDNQVCSSCKGSGIDKQGKQKCGICDGKKFKRCYTCNGKGSV